MEGLYLAGGSAKIAKKCLHIDVILSFSGIPLLLQHCLTGLQNNLNTRVLEVIVDFCIDLWRTDL